MKAIKERCRLKFVATINDEALSESTDPNFELEYIDIGNVDSYGNIKSPEIYLFNKAPSRARRIVRDGDVIISTVRTYLQAIAYIKDPAENLIVSTGFAVARPMVDQLEPAYFRYAVRDQRFLKDVEARSKGISYPAINSSELADISVPLISKSKQLLVAQFLNSETLQIDSLVAEKERMLALLEKKQAALISRAVTCGLNPKVPTKSSGLDWLGEMPVHWQIERGKNLFSVRDERSEYGNEELLTVSHITGVTSRAEKEVNMFKADDMTGYKKCEKGDFVTNTLWAWMGAMGISPLDGIVSPDYHVYTSKGQILPEFMELLCRSKPFVAEVNRWSKGVWSSRLRLYPENFFEIRFPVPPKIEQKEIVAAIAEYKEKTTELSEALVDSIKLLKERRSALITDAVTGKIPLAEMIG